MVRIPAVVVHFRSFLVFLTGILSALALARIDSLALESTRALTSQVLDCLSSLPAGMISLKKNNWTEMYMFQFIFGFGLFNHFGWFSQSV